MKILASVFAFFLIPMPAFAQIVINEIAWMGTKTEGVAEKQWWRYEWIELYNTSSSMVLLDAWRIELSRDKVDWAIPLHGSVEGHGYFVVSASDKVSKYDITYANLGGKLNNSGQKIVLQDANRSPVEEVDSRDGWFGGENTDKHTMERWKPFKDGNDPGNWGSSKQAGGTPRAENSIANLSTLEAAEVLFDFGGETGREKKDVFQSSVSQILFHPTLLFGFFTALVSALGILYLKKYLERFPGKYQD